MLKNRALSFSFCMTYTALAACSDESGNVPSDASPDGLSGGAQMDATRSDGPLPDAPITPPVMDAAVADLGIDAQPDARPTCPDGGCPLPLFNTGVGPNGTVLAGGSVDPHYTLIESAEGTLPGPDAIVTTAIADGFWLAQSETSKWIAPSSNQAYPGADPCNAGGKYVYRTTFNLSGYHPPSARISGGWAVDNSGVDIRLNGVSLQITSPGFGSLAPFTINTGFAGGINTLEFETLDGGCPNGLRVELSGTASLH